MSLKPRDIAAQAKVAAMAAAEPAADRGAAARRLIRGRDRAALATSLAGRPYASFVITACDSDATPLLLLSDLAQHTKNLVGDPLSMLPTIS